MDIGNHICYLRHHKGWSLLENGRTTPSIESVQRIATAFGMSIPVFLGGADMDLTPDERRMIEAYRAGDLEQMMRWALKRVNVIKAKEL
jgi:transcriptional regulator with XRE-family HTH domain